MATSTLPLLFLLSFLIATASARPCKTLFYFSAATTTTTTYYPSNSLTLNPNDPNSAQIANSQHITLIFTTTTTTSSPRFRNRHFDRFNELAKSLRSESPVKLYSSVSSSVRDRTMDILSVIGALLFGVGCGAVTAAVMFSLWSLFNPRHRDFDELSSSSDDDDDYDDAAYAKKIGYVAIPAQGKLIDDDLAREVV
ncbi:hypothetical protein SASPL_127981 [Salvia splendens]|uniref:Uncharacterized protein n=1 Tax=Salvia splendens TaxID=180675 RepID=A0A8X8XBU9_SALSN|nr:uncharacterized protein LOC121751842 [Salvia splendens]KAG6409939.1 hypothetical protein SASPL_127981 [Salvia splendens]